MCPYENSLETYLIIPVYQNYTLRHILLMQMCIYIRSFLSAHTLLEYIIFKPETKMNTTLLVVIICSQMGPIYIETLWSILYGIDHINIYNFFYYLIAVTHSRSVQDRFVSDVLGVFTNFGSSNIVLALWSDPTVIIIPAGDPAVKKFTKHAKPHSTHLKKGQITATIKFLNRKWPMSFRLMYLRVSWM